MLVCSLFSLPENLIQDDSSNSNVKRKINYSMFWHEQIYIFCMTLNKKIFILMYHQVIADSKYSPMTFNQFVSKFDVSSNSSCWPQVNHLENILRQSILLFVIFIIIVVVMLHLMKMWLDNWCKVTQIIFHTYKIVTCIDMIMMWSALMILWIIIKVMNQVKMYFKHHVLIWYKESLHRILRLANDL